MSFVRQRNKTDCGVATLAMLCDVEYERAKGVIPWRDRRTGGTTTRMLRIGAMTLGYLTKSTPQHRLKTIQVPEPPLGKMVGAEIWNLIPNNSLVKVPRPEHGWHWVVWKKGKVYDPARGVFHPRKYDKIPTSYMEFVSCEK